MSEEHSILLDPLLCYQDSPVRKDWNHPSPAEVAESLNKAHAVGRSLELINRQLVTTVNQLHDDQKKTTTEMEEVKEKLKQSIKALWVSKIKIMVMGGVLGGAAAKGLEVGVVGLINLFAK